MRWPWVSRDVYESETRRAEAWKEQANRECDKYESLLDKYHALKIQGAAVPEEPQKLAPTNMDPVMCAITAKAGPDRKLRAMMSRQAMLARAAGIPDMEIIQQIEQGVSVDDGIPL